MSPTRSTAPLVLTCLSVFLVLLPLAVPTPGTPMTLKADEPAYLQAAVSLALDGDLEFREADARRLVAAYPHRPVENLILMSTDGWQTVYYGKPVSYSVLAAPLAAAFGARGLVAFNMLLFVAMIWLGFSYLRDKAPDGLAALFSASFFLVSVAFAYVFWLHPEVLSMFGIMVCLYPAFARAGAESARWERFLTSPAGVALSGAALSLAVYNKPMLALLGVPALYRFWRERGLRTAGVWLVAAAIGLGGQMAVSEWLTEAPTPYLGTSRAGLKIDDPERLDELFAPFRKAVTGEQTHSSYGWLARVPKLFPKMLLENVKFFFVGRHTGLVPYLPFAAISLLLFLIHDRRDPARWLTIGALAGVAAFFLIWIHYNWHGGAGFQGNRYFVNVYPAFLFLVPALRPAWLTVVGWVLGGLFLAPTLVTPYGASMPAPTLQAHVRGAPFAWLPQELSISAQVPGYTTFTTRGIAVRARQDLMQTVDRGRSSFWIRGGEEVEVWLSAGRPIRAVEIEVESPVAGNDVTLELAGERVTVTPDLGADPVSIRFEPERPTKVRKQWAKTVYAYRMALGSSSGRNPRRPDGEVAQPQFYVGAEIAIRDVELEP